MMLLFSKSNLIGSKLIRWGLDEPVSHFAMAFDEDPKGYGIVFHSHFKGVSIEWFEDWQKRNEIVYAYAPKTLTPLLQEEKIYGMFTRQFYGKRYDNWAMAYWAYCLAKKKLFGTPIPETNKWGEKNKYLCYEIAEGLSNVPFLCIPQVQKEAMISPYGLKELLEKSPYFTEVTHFFRG